MYLTPTTVVALLLWIPISAAAFAILRPQRASILLLTGAVMFLPQLTEFKVPVIPAFDKLSIASLCVLAGCLATAPRLMLRARWGRIPTFLLVILTLGAIGSVWANREPMPCGNGVCDGLLPQTALTFVLEYAFYSLIPFWVGMAMLRSGRDLRMLFAVLAGAGLLYSLPILVELRLSPQLHNWIYGFMQHSWRQHVRGTGYRPIVFMEHGLAVAMFCFNAALAAAGMAKARVPLLGRRAILATVYLFVILLLCKSVGSIAYGLICLPLVLLASVRNQLRVAVLLSVLVLTYPVTRYLELLPTTKLVEWSAKVSDERAASLATRFDNEDRLFEKGFQRPIFGWGGFARIRIFDSESGKDITITDGFEVILWSSRGLSGFVPMVGLLLLPVFVSYRRIGRIARKEDRILIGCLSVMTAINAVELIPNGLYSYFPFLFSGALYGLVRDLSKQAALAARQQRFRQPAGVNREIRAANQVRSRHLSGNDAST